MTLGEQRRKPDIRIASIAATMLKRQLVQHIQVKRAEVEVVGWGNWVSVKPHPGNQGFIEDILINRDLFRNFVEGLSRQNLLNETIKDWLVDKKGNVNEE